MTFTYHGFAIARLMITAGLLLVFPGPFACVPTASAALPVTLLECDFDSEPIDQILANGGAAAGQPYWLGGIDAYVRDAPFATPCVELTDDWGSGAKFLWFAFLNGWEVTSGQMSIEADLWFAGANSYGFYLREAGSTAVPFLTLYFTAWGEVRYNDLDTPTNVLIGTYATGRSQLLRIDIDLDAETYDLSLDSTPLLTGESMGALPRGIATILVGHGSDGDSEGTYYLGELRASASETPSPVEPTSWGRVKGRFR